MTNKNSHDCSTSSEEAASSSASSTCNSTDSPATTSTAASSTPGSPGSTSFLSVFKLNTLNNIACALFIFLLQLYIIYERFSLLRTLNSLSISDTFLFSFNYVANLPSNKFQGSIIINGFLITFALIFAIIAFVLGLFKLGVYSHDSFILGKNFDKSKVNKDLFSTDKLTVISIVSTGSDTASNTSTENSKQKLTQKKSKIRARLSGCSFLRKPAFWTEMPPIGIAFHLLAAFLLLVSEVQLSSKRIQLGQKPIGDIFATKLDFIFGEPIYRLRHLNLNRPREFAEFAKQQNRTSTNNISPADINSIIQSKDDFSVFASQTENYRKNISLIYLNFLIALLLLIVKLSQAFWYTSKKFALLLFCYLANVCGMIALSFTSYEVLFKANNLKQVSAHFVLSNYLKTDKVQDLGTTSPINFQETYSHDLVLTGLFLASSFLLLASGYLNAKFGFRKFEMTRNKFESNIGKYLSKSFLKQHGIGIPTSVNTSSTDCGLSSVSPKDMHCHLVSQKNINAEKSTTKTSPVRYIKSCLKFTGQYLEPLISSFVFLVYATLRIFFIYEIFVVYKFTNDSMYTICIASELITILVWVLIIMLLTVKNDWSFSLHSAYKLNYWNYLYTNYLSETISQAAIDREQRVCRSRASCGLTTESSSKNESSATQTKKSYTEDILAKSREMSTWIDDKESENEQGPEDMTLTTNQQNLPKSTTAINTKNSAGLLVRDDSLTMNRSSNLSSSSITEVSSLMPSTSAHFMSASQQQQQQNQRKSTILDVSQYIASDEEFKRLKTIRNSARHYTDDIDYKFLFNKNNNNQGHNVDNNAMQINQNLRRSLRPNSSSGSSLISNSLKTQLVSNSMRPFANSTIGEIMERRNVLASFSGNKPYSQPASKSTVTSTNDLAMTTSDSGRDSLDSPNNCLQNVSAMLHGSASNAASGSSGNNNNIKMLSMAKPYLTESTGSSIGSLSGGSSSNSSSKVKLTANSTHLLDTHC